MVCVTRAVSTEIRKERGLSEVALERLAPVRKFYEGELVPQLLRVGLEIEKHCLKKKTAVSGIVVKRKK